LRRVVERYIEDPLAEEILRQNIQKGSVVRLEPDGKKLLFFPETPDAPNVGEVPDEEVAEH
jgi:ATP-dependent Clp protease ATP-binding subunit ClpA